MSDGAGKYRRLLSWGTENVAQGFYDDYVEELSRFRAEAGLKVTIIRDEMGDCCSWCHDLAGVYGYEDAPEDVWARHAHCRCIVTTKTEKGEWQDAWSKKRYQSFRDNRIAREKEILTDQMQYEESLQEKRFSLGIGEDVTNEYIRNARPFRGRLTYENDFDKENNKDEIVIGKWLNKTFGGDVLFRTNKNKPDGVKQPDYLFRGKLWDLKTTSTEKSANAAIKKGLRQINSNPGGIVLDYGSHAIDNEKLKEVIRLRMQWYPNAKLDIIVKEGDRFSVVRFK